MSKKVKFVLNRKGVSEILKSGEMDAALESKAGAIVSGLPDGYRAQLHSFKKRDAVYIFPETKEAFRDNWKNHTLSRCL